MNGVTFGTKHSFREWGLVMKERPNISPPKAQIKQVSVPGSDTVLDLTQSLTGYVHYELRKITFSFALIGNRSRWPGVYADIVNQLHGKQLRICTDDDPNYYYLGRVSVGDIAQDVAEATMTITATVEPYKYERYGNGRRL